MPDPTPIPSDRRKVADDIRGLLSALDGLAPDPQPSEELRRNLETFIQASGGSASLELVPVGVVESELRSPVDAPKQGTEGAPDAWLVIQSQYTEGLAGLAPGDQLLVLTWLHRADRRILQVHPRDDAQKPMTGVFRTRSADRPNPIGLHQVTLREMHGNRLRVGPFEAVDGTPILDLKPVL